MHAANVRTQTNLDLNSTYVQLFLILQPISLLHTYPSICFAGVFSSFVSVEETEKRKYLESGGREIQFQQVVDVVKIFSSCVLERSIFDIYNTVAKSQLDYKSPSKQGIFQRSIALNG